MADDSSARSDLPRAVSVLGLCVLAFLGGAITTEFESFPYPQLLERPLFAVRSYVMHQSRGRSPTNSITWQPAVYEGRGVVDHRPEAAGEGMTLYVSGPKQGAQLIDMDGDVVHHWQLPFREAFADAPHVDRPVGPSGIRWTAAHLFPNGDLLVNYEADGATPYGYGLVKIDRHSQVLWRLPARTHHTFDVGDDGRVYVADQRFRPTDETPIDDNFNRAPYQLDDRILVVSSDGEVEQQLSMLDLIGNSENSSILQFWYDHKVEWDRIHLNSVAPVGEAFARHHPFASPGDVLVSMRSLNAVALVDLESETLEWSSVGPWIAQHDAEPLPNGHLLLFDNKGHAGPGGRSRILEYDPAADRIVWRYTGTADAPFQTGWAGGQSLLPNGNVLINESVRGRIFEVTRDGEIVWDFRNPERTTHDGREYVGLIGHNVQRVRPDELNVSFSE